MVANILHEALKRKNFLYRNMSLEKSIKHYFQQEVMKKMYESEDPETE
jgi:hypothetical protein